MKKKILIIIGIALVVLFAIYLITSFKDSARVRNNMEPKYEIDETERKLDNEKTIKYKKTIDNTTISFDISEDWKLEELPKDTEDDFYKFALKIYKTNEERYAVLYFYNQIFGVCGTGRTSKELDLDNGNKAIIGYYDGKETWEDISFFETNKDIAILNNGLDKEESDEFIKLIKTISIKEINENEKSEDKEAITLSLKNNTLSNTGATFILKNNTDKEYGYGPEYIIETKSNDEWKEVDTITGTPLVWNTITYILKANEEKELNVDWSYGYGELESGEYRLVKSTFKEKDRPIDETKKVYLYTKFEIK